MGLLPKLSLTKFPGSISIQLFLNLNEKQKKDSINTNREDDVKLTENKKIWLASPHMSDEGYEMQYVREAFDTNWVAPLGPNVNEFEKELAAKVGSKHAAAMTSGTGAIHLALKAAGVGEGDVVFCPTLTFSATANPIIYQNATPVFIDSDYETWNMDPKALEAAFEKYGDKVKAVLVVHLYGLSADMDKIMEICSRYNVTVIEDAAESLGAYYKGRHTGTFGEFGVFSFNGNKIITTSGGGALCCPDEESRNRVKFYATQARDQAPHYEHTHIGYNYRLSNVCAGIGRGQMRSLPSFLEKRRGIHEEYLRRLSGAPGLSLLENPDSRYHSNHWLTCVQVNPEEARFDRETLRLALQKAGVESRPLWKPMHLQPVFRSCPFYGSGVSDRLFEQGLCLPSGASLAGEDVDRIIDVLLNL